MPYLVYKELLLSPELAGVLQRFGSQYLEEHASALRIVWVPKEEEREGPEVGDYPVSIFKEITPAAPVTIAGADANGAVKYLYKVAGVRVAHEFSGWSLGEAVVVTGLDVSVRLAVNASGVVTSTAASLTALVNGTPAAAALLTAYAQGTGLGLARSSPRVKLRSIATRVVLVELHLYAPDHDAMTRRPGGLINQTWYALWRAARGSLRIEKAEWATDAISDAGAAYTMNVKFLLPVLEELPAAQVQTATVTPPPEVV